MRRAKYIAAFMQTSDKKIAHEESGLSPNAHLRIIKSICRYGNLSDGPRSGRPLVYTDPMMKAAFNRVATDDTAKLTGKKLVMELKNKGVLHQSANLRRFLPHLSLYVEKKGYNMISNYRRTTFFLNASDKVTRLAYARHMLDLLNSGKSTLSHLVFSDEVTLEEAPHPKGMQHS
jgi:hypothetical protein